jgi:hypothetical protein
MFIGKLNGFYMCVGDISSLYLLSKPCEKIAFVAGSDFGEYAGHAL